jgi:hypothetical protein
MRLSWTAKLVDSPRATSSPGLHAATGAIGGDNLASWPNRPSRDYFTGQIDEVRGVQPRADRAEVSEHYLKGTGSPRRRPRSRSRPTTRRLGQRLDVVGPPGRTITSYSWNWGDGTAAGSGVTATHPYANGGTYTVTLT